jgi:branched-chain amino acid transport system substrate-binding protein
MIFRRLLLLILAAGLVFVSAGCDEEAPPPQPIEKAGYRYIGLVAPRSGYLRPLGLSMIRGAELAVDKANETPSKRPFRLKIVDESAEAAGRSSLAADPTVSIVVGHATERSLEKSRSLYVEHGRAVILPIINDAQAADLARGYVFRLPPSWPEQAAALADFSAGELNAGKALVVYEDSDQGRAALKAFTDAFNAKGPKEITEAVFPDDPEVLAKLAETAAGSQPDAVFLALHAQPALYLAQALARAKVGSAVLTTSAAALPDTMALLTTLFEHVFVTLPLDPADPDEAFRDFNLRFETMHQRPAPWPALLTYDAVGLAVEALNKGEDDPEKVRQYLVELGAFRGLIGEYRFGPTASSPVKVLRVEPTLMARLPCLGAECGPELVTVEEK